MGWEDEKRTLPAGFFVIKDDCAALVASSSRAG